MKKLRLGAIALVSLALAGCYDYGSYGGGSHGAGGYGSGQKQGFGTLLGAVTGAVVGAQFGSGNGQLAATAAGTLVGALIGNSVGASLDRIDLEYAAQAQYEALEYEPTGSERQWHNPDTGHRGTVSPGPAYRDERGAYCREYQHTVTIAGEQQQAYGPACRQPDGTWKVVG